MTLELIPHIVFSLEIGQILCTAYQRWKICPRTVTAMKRDTTETRGTDDEFVVHRFIKYCETNKQINKNDLLVL